jgi:pemK-like protein 1
MGVSNDKRDSRKAINFDLSTNTLEELFDKGNTKKPYADIKKFMEENGFMHRQYSGYVAVLKPKAYNKKTSLFICVPLTTKVKSYPFEVAISGEKDGVALADHVKSLDWRARNAKYKGKITQEELGKIQERLGLFLGI